MDFPLLQDIIIIFGLAIAVVFASRKLKIPSIVGLLLTGVVGGPYGLGLIREVENVDKMAEVGVVLLLFTLGIEFSVESLLRMKREVLVGGTLQVGLTVAAVTMLAVPFDLQVGPGVFYGCLLAVSSTALVLKVLQERAEVDSPHGRLTLGILVFQDMAVVPMVLAVPLLAGGGSHSPAGLLLYVVKAVAVVAASVFLARWAVPKLLYQAARMRDRELFLFTVLFIGLAVAWITSAVGLSLALGAFLAGLIISESEYSHKALSDILPFRDIFTSFFFVSVGMLLNPRTLLDNPGLVVLPVLAVFLFKTVLTGMAGLILGFPLRTAVLAGLALFQVGEFSFVLSHEGLKHGLLGPETYQIFLGVTVLTMVATPFVMAHGRQICSLLLRLPLPQPLKDGFGLVKEPPTRASVADHLIIVGFGLGGRHLALAASASAIPYTVIELNPETVRKERNRGQPMLYGDATQEAVLRHAGVDRARVLAVAVPDSAGTRRVVEIARRLNPKLYILARTPFVPEMEPLYRLGADEVIPTEFETSVEIFSRVLVRYMVPSDEIQRIISEVRADGYRMFRTPSRRSTRAGDLSGMMAGVEVSTFRVEAGSAAAGKSLAELDLRRQYHTTLLAVRRGDQVVSNPSSEERLHAGDAVVALGTPEHLARLAAFLRGA